MAKVGRLVTDPKVVSYCRITVDSGGRIMVSRQGRGGSGSVAIDEVRWWGFLPGARVFACDLESAEGQGLWATSLRARARAVLGQRHWAQLSST